MPVKLFSMPSSLSHFSDKEPQYVNNYAKGLYESCCEIRDNNYVPVFKQWTAYFLPQDMSKTKIYFQDFLNIRRKLVALVDEFVFEEERKAGKIGRQSPFIGEKSLARRKLRQQSNEAFLSKHFNTVVGNISELEITTKQAKTYFAEKYNFCVGIEEYAKDLGYQCLFVTMTVPPRMHANPNNGNSSWDGTTVKQAKDYLVEKWKKFTNDLSRKKHNIKMSEGDLFGVRVLEPHLSATPHMHALIYTSAELIKDKVPELLKKHFGKSDLSPRLIPISR